MSDTAENIEVWTNEATNKALTYLQGELEILTEEIDDISVDLDLKNDEDVNKDKYAMRKMQSALKRYIANIELLQG